MVSGRIARLEFARSRMPLLSDMCLIIPPPNSGRSEVEVSCAVETPTLKLGHGYGKEGGGPTQLSRRVTKSILFDMDVQIEPGDIVEWLETGDRFDMGESAIQSTLEPYVMINATIRSPRKRAT